MDAPRLIRKDVTPDGSVQQHAHGVGLDTVILQTVGTLPVGQYALARRSVYGPKGRESIRQVLGGGG